MVPNSAQFKQKVQGTDKSYFLCRTANKLFPKEIVSWCRIDIAEKKQTNKEIYLQATSSSL